jgi:methylated-DNA-[protein]-cysteine S-methyltransferase
VTEYLAGSRREFSVPLAPEGTEFTRRVWEACRRIPYGRTVSYGELAAQAGSPRGARAVGQALGRNRIPLLIPCHRVLAGQGALGGFGGGLEMKKRLLDLESRSGLY